MPGPVRRKVPKQPLIFLHIPKAGGTTLHGIIERQYDPSCIFSIDGTRIHESIREFTELPEEERGRLLVLKGHMSFGLHRLLPRSFSYITMVRNPVERVISNYYFLLRAPKHPLHETIKGNNISLADAVASEMFARFNNSQTKMLSGIDVESEKEPAKLLETAKENLQKFFSVVGLTERFDETILLIKRAFAWKLPFYVKENVSKNRPGQESLSNETLEIIKKANDLDIELYEYAKGLFERKFRQQDMAFRAELFLFQCLNRELWVKPMNRLRVSVR